MPFKDYAAAGFLTELLPILPPGVEVSPASAHRDNLEKSRGKVPGKRTNAGWVGFSDWAAHETTDSDVATWSRWGAGIGLQGRLFPGLDIDVEDSELADAIDITAALELGFAPTRFGRGSRRLRVYAGPGFKKRRLAFRLPRAAEGAGPGERGARDAGGPRDGSANDLDPRGAAAGDANPAGDPGWTVHAVELLGAGQQYVLEGVHPKTGLPYRWADDSPVDYGAEGLTTITLEEIERFFEAVRWAVEDLWGGEIIENARGRQVVAGADNVDQETLRAPGLAEVEAALLLIDNED